MLVSIERFCLIKVHHLFFLPFFKMSLKSLVEASLESKLLLKNKYV